MCKSINVLIVEDEPLTIGVYENALNHIGESNSLQEIKIRSVTNADLAIQEIDKAVNSIPFDLVLLDISIPPSTDEKILSGEDIGVKLRNLFPKIKIVVLTSYNNNYRLNNILKSLNPDGFLIKSEVNFPKLLEALDAVLHEPPFYTKAIQKLIRRHVSHDFVVDKIDRQILYHLFKGAKTKELTELVNLSTSAVETRKYKLKETFNIGRNGSDRELFLKAELAGFL